MHALTDVNNIKITYQPFPKNLWNSQILNSGVGERGCREGGGGGGWLWYECASQYFKTYPIHIPGLWKHGPIDILDHLKCWPIHILSFEFLYPFAGCQTNIIVSSLNTKRTSSLEKSLSEKYVNIPGCQKNGAFHIGILKNRVMHILFVEKKEGQSYNWQRLKGHSARTSVLWHMYRKLPPPPLPAPHTHPPRDRESPSKPKTLHHFNVELTKMMIRWSSFTLVRHTCSSCVYGSFWGIDVKYSKQKKKNQAWTKT